MKIRLHHTLRPFSHVPGSFAILPRTHLRFQIFPALIKVWEMTSYPKLIAEMALKINGPVKDFTVQLDLEKGLIKVWGFSPSSHWRYSLKMHLKGFELKFDKQPMEVILSSISQCRLIKEKDCLVFETPTPFLLAELSSEKLSLGISKAQCWDQIHARKNLAEIFPFWLRLGQLLPRVSIETLGEGTTSFLAKLKNKEKSFDFTFFDNLYEAGFASLLSPRLEDEQFQGFNLPPLINDKQSPLVLLQEGANLIRSLFFEESGQTVKILPLLPSQFYCGKYVNINSGKGIFHLEWTKKNLRRMIFESSSAQTLHLKFSSNLKSFRLQSDPKEKGIRVSTHETLSFVKNKLYFFDCFEK